MGYLKLSIGIKGIMVLDTGKNVAGNEKLESAVFCGSPIILIQVVPPIGPMKRPFVSRFLYCPEFRKAVIELFERKKGNPLRQGEALKFVGEGATRLLVFAVRWKNLINSMPGWRSSLWMKRSTGPIAKLERSMKQIKKVCYPTAPFWLKENRLRVTSNAWRFKAPCFVLKATFSRGNRQYF